MNKQSTRSAINIKQYAIITGNYWVFTLTDGALRMLIVLHFYNLGFGPLKIALLFVFYEFFGVVTNLFGGWLGARIGLNRTMNIGLVLQIVALSMLLLPTNLLYISWVMAAQALSGIAKDLNKMSAKSAIKLFIPSETHETTNQTKENSAYAQPNQHRLFKYVAALTGSKNALKGVGFFLGGFLLSTLGFTYAILTMVCLLLCVWTVSMFTLNEDLGKTKFKAKFTDVFSSNPSINYLAAARLFLFAARDIWFVVALPVYLSQQFQWSHQYVGGFLALWIIGYGLVQSFTPTIIGKKLQHGSNKTQYTSNKNQAVFWAVNLALIPAAIALSLQFTNIAEASLTIGLAIFGIVFAVNSSLHSFLIVSYAREEGSSLDVGFYYTANAIGRLLGTVLSGWIFQVYGLIPCLWISSILIAITIIISTRLPHSHASSEQQIPHIK